MGVWIHPIGFMRMCMGLTLHYMEVMDSVCPRLLGSAHGSDRIRGRVIRMTLNLLQIKTSNSRWWRAYLWVYVIAGALVAVPLAVIHLGSDQWDRVRSPFR